MIENNLQLDKQSLPTYKNLFVNDSGLRPDYGIVICGHRGGMGYQNEPDNTMRAFKKAKILGLQMIEFDIWLTADDQLIVIHGGDNGEMPHPFHITKPNNCESKDSYRQDLKQENHKYIFEQKFSDLQSQFKETECYIDSAQDQDSLIPTVNQLFEFLKPNPICMNIEIKVPLDQNVRSTYRWKECAQKLYELILEHQLQDFSIVQSFNKECLDTLREIDVDSVIYPLYLHNFWYYDPRPSMDQMTNEMGIGSHLQINSIDTQMVQEMHESGNIVVVWVDATAPKEIYVENDDFYRRCYDLGVDMITTDHVERAHYVLSQYHIHLKNDNAQS